MRKLLGLMLFAATGLALAGDLAGKWNVSAEAPGNRTYTFVMTVKTGANPSA